MNIKEDGLGRISLGWKSRHIAVVVLGVVLTYLFLVSRGQWSDMHKWNRAVGDASLVLVAMSMAIGPLSRLFAGARRLMPWRRELGIYGVLLAFAHAIIIVFGWVQLDFMRLFGFEFHPQLQRYVMFQQGFGLANILGIFALGYAAVLALTSNNFSQRFLGASVWKYVQQGTYVLWWLIVLHTGYFLFMHFQDFDRPVPEPNWAQWPFVWLVVLVSALQLAATVRTWRMKNSRNPAATR